MPSQNFGIMHRDRGYACEAIRGLDKGVTIELNPADVGPGAGHINRLVVSYKRSTGPGWESKEYAPSARVPTEFAGSVALVEAFWDGVLKSGREKITW